MSGFRPSGLPEEAVREGLTMALYVCIVLAAEFVAVGDVEVEEEIVLGVVWGTAMGLAVAHVFAFDLTARLFGRGRLGGQAKAAVWTQLAAAAGVALIVSIPFLLFALEDAMDVAGFFVAAVIGITAYGASRSSGAGGLRSGAYASVALLVAVLVVSVKVVLSGP